jgi:radical SAM superfamily enzyme YgiQ (UPF0313 family)
MTGLFGASDRKDPAPVNILLYNPDNGVTRNYMPHLWMFLLQRLTPPEHKVFLIDGNARPMNEQQLAAFVLANHIGLVGIGAMTRMIARAYRAADAIRETGVPVVMGGPHVTELPDEALGRDGGKRHADAVAVGEADETWPVIVEDAANGRLKALYEPVDAEGKERKPSLDNYPDIGWADLDLEQFNLVPKLLRRRLGKTGWGSFRLIPLESGRGCPYGCEFCTVTGFFGDSLRFRSNESIVAELLALKSRTHKERGRVAVFFVDDNFAINRARTKSLLRDIIAAGAQVPWIAQISANLLQDAELVDLIAQSGGRWIFIGMESIDEGNLKDVNKSFNKPASYQAVLESLAAKNIYAITSFIFGMDNDRVGAAGRTLAEIEKWPPGLPVFGQLTPFPATPLYERLKASGRLLREKHWLDFAPFVMCHEPLHLTVEQARQEVDAAWRQSYSPRRNRDVIDYLSDKPIGEQIIHLLARIAFRGIYFPQVSRIAWLRAIAQNWRLIGTLTQRTLTQARAARASSPRQHGAPCQQPLPESKGQHP